MQNSFTKHTAEDIFRLPTDRARPIMQSDMDEIARLIEIAIRAVLPANVFVTPQIKIQHEGHRGPAALQLPPYKVGFLEYDCGVPIGKLIGASIIEMFPLRVFTGIADGNLNHTEFRIEQNPKSFSGHQRIENQMLLRETFGATSPIIQYLNEAKPA